MIFTRTLVIVGWKIWYQYYPPFFYDIYYFYLSINTLLICNHPNSQPTHKTQWVTVISTQANFQPNIINVKDTVFQLSTHIKGLHYVVTLLDQRHVLESTLWQRLINTR